MLKIEDPLNFNLLDKNNNKQYYLSKIRELANKGNYFSLINFIEYSIPSVSKSYYYLIFNIYSSFLYIQKPYFISIN